MLEDLSGSEKKAGLKHSQDTLCVHAHACIHAQGEGRGHGQTLSKGVGLRTDG